MKYYLIETSYVGPNRTDSEGCSNLADREGRIDIQTVPGYTNMSNQEKTNGTVRRIFYGYDGCLEDIVDSIIDSVGTDSGAAEIWDIDDYFEDSLDDVSAEMSDDDFAQMIAEVETNMENENVVVDGDVEEYYNLLRYQLRDEKILDYIDETYSGKWYQQTTTDGENPIYEIRLDDGTVRRIFYGYDGCLEDIVDSVGTDFRRAYQNKNPDGTYPNTGNWFNTPDEHGKMVPIVKSEPIAIKIYRDLLRYCDGTFLRLKSQDQKYNPLGQKIILISSRNSNWRPLILCESEDVYSAYQHYNHFYPYTYLRNNRLRKEKANYIEPLKARLDESQKKFTENKNQIITMKQKITELERENEQLAKAISEQTELVKIRTDEAEKIYQEKLNK